MTVRVRRVCPSPEAAEEAAAIVRALGHTVTVDGCEVFVTTTPKTISYSSEARALDALSHAAQFGIPASLQAEPVEDWTAAPGTTSPEWTLHLGGAA